MKSIPWRWWWGVIALGAFWAGSVTAQEGVALPVGSPPFVLLNLAPDPGITPKRYTAGSELLVGVVAVDNDGTIDRVQLALDRLDYELDDEGETVVERTRVGSWWLNGEPLVKTLALPLTSDPVTEYELVVLATDDDGNTTSAVETLNVFNTDRPLPQVRFESPLNGAETTVGATMAVSLTVNAFGQALAGVGIYEDDQLIELLTEAPYALDYTPLRAGPHALVAVPYTTTMRPQTVDGAEAYYEVYTAAQGRVAFAVKGYAPLTEDADFVEQTFRDLLLRSASTADLLVWLPQLTGGSLTRSELIATLMDSAVSDQTREILAANLVVVGAWPTFADFTAQLEAWDATSDDALVDLIDDLLLSPSYVARYGEVPSLTDLAAYAEQEKFAKQVYQHAFGRDPTLVEITAVANAPGSLNQATGYNVAGSVAGFFADFVRKHRSDLEDRVRVANVRLGLTRMVPGVAQVESDAEGAVSELAASLMASTDYTNRFLSLEENPRSLRVAEGAGALLQVRAAGSGEGLTYQWYQDGRAQFGATTPTFVLRDAAAEDTGAYYAVVRGPTGMIASESAIVAVVPGGTARLSNLSTRALIGSGAEALITGFAMNGAEDLSLLARVVGPTLNDLGIAGAASDPSLVVVQGNVAITENDDWSAGSAKEVQALRDAAAKVGAFALREGSADAAVVTALATTSNSSVVGSSDGETGEVALNEIYDLGSSDSRLINLSSRARVGTGEQVLVGGFVIAGNVSRRVLIRAVGPGLLTYGVTHALANPQLELYSGPTLLASNDDWSATADPDQLAQLASAAGAFALTPGSLDAALVLSLDPGAYTVVVSGVANTTGVALVEIYDLDP